MPVLVGGELSTRRGARLQLAEVAGDRKVWLRLSGRQDDGRQLLIELDLDEARGLKLRLEAGIGGLDGKVCEHNLRPILCRECLQRTPNPADCITPLTCRARTSCPRERACSE
jgi:hypothetical protein